MDPTSDCTAIWDARVQDYHGGQDWVKLENFFEDFSVTTNALGTPETGLNAARQALDHIGHYPAADQEPAKSALARFLWPESHEQDKERLLLGNGASELIDLVTRMSPRGTWKPGPWDVQYTEYQRSARIHGYTFLQATDTARAHALAIVNPCNPTGDYKSVQEMKDWIQDNVQDGGSVMIDESMQPWHSSDFRLDSMACQRAFVQQLYHDRKISVYVIHSWTKLWCCTGLRIGSVVSPTAEHTQAIKYRQVPWSVNNVMLAFLDAVTRDHDYMQRTWALTTSWHAALAQSIKALNPEWELHGREFLSWIWIDVKSTKMADRVVALAKTRGIAVRHGLHGYGKPTFVRVAVREPAKCAVLLESWEPLRATS